MWVIVGRGDGAFGRVRVNADGKIPPGALTTAHIVALT
jgi:hypothetical protein